MKRLKTKYYIVLILACLSLISVGFSSWIISEPAYKEIEGIIEVDNVIRSNEFMETRNTKSFDYYAYAFTYVEGENQLRLSKKAYLEYEVKINIDECRRFFQSNTLEIDFKLVHPFYHETAEGITIKSYINTSSTPITTSNNTNSNIISTYTISDLQTQPNELTLTLSYEFEITNSSNYQLQYIQNLNNQKEFGMSAKLIGRMS